MRLCVMLRTTPSALPHSVTCRDYLELARFYAMEPWDETRGDVRIALLCTIVASMAGSKGSKPKPADFMPFLVSKGERMSAEDMHAFRRQYQRMHADRFTDN